MLTRTRQPRHASAEPGAGFPAWFDADVQRRLERFALGLRRGAHRLGEYHSVRRGGQLDFLEHRAYAIGDDLKFLDWNVYGRLSQLHVKTYSQEQHTTVTLLVDASASMEFPAGATDNRRRQVRRRPDRQAGGARPPATKFEAALLVASAFAFVALNGGNRVKAGIADGPGDRPRWLPPRTGTAGFLSLMRELAVERHARGGRFADTLAWLATQPRLSGPIVILTDGYDAPMLRHSLERLAARPDVTVVLIHLLSADELAPTLDGATELIDAETGSAVPVGHVEPALAQYRDALARFVDEWKQACARTSAAYVLTPAGGDMLDTVLAGLHRTGVVV